MREAGDIQVKSVCLYDSHWLKAEGIIALECEALQGNEKKLNTLFVHIGLVHIQWLLMENIEKGRRQEGYAEFVA